jgi:hypothetical protein
LTVEELWLLAFGLQLLTVEALWFLVFALQLLPLLSDAQLRKVLQQHLGESSKMRCQV